MLKINRNSHTMTRLSEVSLPQAGLKERADLQQMIRNSPEEFFHEMGEKLLLIGEELRPTGAVDDRIDLLALDTDGNCLVIELKRGAHKMQLLQAMSYAAMLADWEPDRVIEERARLMNCSKEDAADQIERFLQVEIDEVNAQQRLVLVAEDYDYSLLVTAEWLTERYELDVRCFRVCLAADQEAEYLTCTCIYPPVELADHAKARRRVTSRPVNSRWQSWDEAIDAMENDALADFFRAELNSGRENNLGRRSYLVYRLGGVRRFSVSVRRQHGYTWQSGRFDGDLEFWTKRLSDEAKPEVVKEGRALRFYLSSADDLEVFSRAVNGELEDAVFEARGQGVA